MRRLLRYRWLLMFFLMAHCPVTELLQVALSDYCHRTGSLGDVGFDLVGIFIGILVSWKWWTQPDDAEPPPDPSRSVLLRSHLLFIVEYSTIAMKQLTISETS